MRRMVALVAALLAAALPAAEPKRALAPVTVEYGEPRQLATLANPAITESSGVACSRRTPDAFWTHNDSGDAARLYAFNSKGEDLGTWQVRGARARDWEDVASFQKDGQSFLLIGDVGDNECHHKAYTLYLVPEPPADPTRRGVRGTTEPAVAIEFRYEDGPHNCEAIAIDPTTMTVYLVIKVTGPECGVFHACRQVVAPHSQRLTHALPLPGFSSPPQRGAILGGNCDSDVSDLLPDASRS
jgi:hypothetical protein